MKTLNCYRAEEMDIGWMACVLAALGKNELIDEMELNDLENAILDLQCEAEDEGSPAGKRVFWNVLCDISKRDWQAEGINPYVIDPEELTDKACDLLDDDDIYLEAIEALDKAWGFTEGCGLYPMSDLDSYFIGVPLTEILQQIDLEYFDPCDEYFCDERGGITSTSEPCEYYRNLWNNAEIVDSLVEITCVDIADDDLRCYIETLRKVKAQ